MIPASVLQQFNQLLLHKVGMHFPASSIKVLEQRISAKLSQLNLSKPDEFLQILQDDPKQFEKFLDFVTTNLSYFYREPHHYKILEQYVIPQIKANGIKKVRIWSAGCSTGEEPYTLAMLFDSLAPNINWEIYATDISSTCLDIAKKGIYPEKRIDKLPENLSKKYMLRLGEHHIKQIGSPLILSKAIGNPEGLGYRSDDLLWQVKPALREKVKFLYHNLCDFSHPDFIPRKFHLIFCRNVLIYFPSHIQEQVVNNFHNLLSTSGCLFLGHTEHISNMNTPFVPFSLGSTCYLPSSHPLAGEANTWQRMKFQEHGESTTPGQSPPPSQKGHNKETVALKDLRTRIKRNTAK